MGFKAQEMLFTEYLTGPRNAGAGRGHEVAMVSDRATVRDMRPGRLEQTSNPLDIALRGDGYLVVGTDQGPRYTRDGRLTLDPQRRLVNPDGLPVLNDNNQPITIPATAGEITITGTGHVVTETGPVGRLALVQFDDPSGVVPLGGGLVATNEVPTPAADVQVVQGMVEQSNVEPVLQLTQMIETARQYQSTQQLIDGEHERVRSTIQKLARPQP